MEQKETTRQLQDLWSHQSLDHQYTASPAVSFIVHVL